MSRSLRFSTGNLNFDLTKKIMDEVKPNVEMRTRLLHAFFLHYLSRRRGNC